MTEITNPANIFSGCFALIANTARRQRVVFMGTRDPSRIPLNEGDVYFRFFDILSGEVCAQASMEARCGGYGVCMPGNAVNISGRYYIGPGEIHFRESVKALMGQESCQGSKWKRISTIQKIMDNLECDALFESESSGRYYEFIPRTDIIWEPQSEENSV